MKEPQNTEYRFEPTEKWLRTKNPVGQTEVLKWYKREQQTLKERCSRPVKRKIECWILIVDRTTGKVLRRSKKPKTYTTELWKLSTTPNINTKTKEEGPSDYQIYQAVLDKRFKELMKRYSDGRTTGKNSHRGRKETPVSQ